MKFIKSEMKSKSYLFNHSVNKSNGSQEGEESDKSIAVPFETEVDRRRIHNRRYQWALCCQISSRNHNCHNLYRKNSFMIFKYNSCLLLWTNSYFFIIVKTGLNHFSTTEEGVSGVLFRVVKCVRVKWKRCFCYRNTFT